MDETEKILNTSQLVLTILESDEGINKYLKKTNISIDKNKQTSITKILSVLSNDVDGKSSLNEIIDTLTDITEDGKIKLNEIIKLVNVLIKNVKDIDITEFNIDNEDFAVLLKLILVILDETGVINIEDDGKLVFDSIDSCVFLLNQMQEVEVEINDSDSDKSKEQKNENNNENKEENNKKSSRTIKIFCLKFNY
jgi:hypothetical protein